MKRNIELKARWPDPEGAHRIARGLGADPAGRERQEDTYFRVPRGRLKLRRRWLLRGGDFLSGEAAGAPPSEVETEAQLIWYQRSDGGGTGGASGGDGEPGRRPSDYRLFTVPAGGALADLLRSGLEVIAEVEKERAVYLHQGVRIHIDRVGGQGTFIEFEAIVEGSADDGEARERLTRLQGAFGIVPEMLVDASYSDLAGRKAAPG